MLEKTPAAVGHALGSVRAGIGGIASADPAFATVPETIVVRSAAFAHDAPLPANATADGAGVSPPLSWDGVPESAQQLVLVVEDSDSPTPSPLVHAIAFDLPLDRTVLDAGALDENDGVHPLEMGKSSALRTSYLPPDPPTGHGPHHYHFQLFALDQRLPLSDAPGRRELLHAMHGHVLARGSIVGIYERS